MPPRRVAGRHRAVALLDQLGEAQQVQVRRVDAQQVARRPGDQHGRRLAGSALGLEHLAQVGDVGLQGAGHRRRRVVAPQRADDAVDADHAAGVGQQQRQQGPGLGASDVHGRPVGSGDLERAEDSEAHRRMLPGRVPSAATLFGAQVPVQVGCKYPARDDGDSGSRPVQTRGAAAAAPRGNPLMSIESTAVTFDDAVLDTLAPAIPAADVDDLRSQVHGPVYAAGDDGLAAEVATWNVAIQHTPAVAVGATCAADVAAAVTWAVAHDLRVAVQATGHGPVRNAAGSMMITTRRMQGMHIDPERRIARVEAGVRWIRVMEAAAEFGLAGLCGSSSDVGVVGYTLGGGHGLARPQARLRRRPRDAPSRSSPPTAGCAGSAPTPSPSCSGPSAAARATSASSPPWSSSWCRCASLFGGGIFFAGDDAPALLHRVPRVGADPARGGQHLDRDPADPRHGGAAAAAARADRRPPAVRLRRHRPRRGRAAARRR